MHKYKTFFNWSSGKDASMALYAMLNSKEYSVELLLTTISKKFDRVTMHGLHRSLLKAQAKAIGLRLEILALDENPSMEDYNTRMGNKLKEFKMTGFTHTGFGDIFLEDLKNYREAMLAPMGINAVFPLWKKDTRQLILDFIDSGFKAIVVCCNAQLLPESFCGRLIDRDFIRDLPTGIDPCGENGEFHTFCFDGPLFRQPVHFCKGEIVYKTYPAPKTSGKQTSKEYGFWYCDLKSME